MSGVSRRTLLKGGLAGVSSVVLGPDFFWKCLGLQVSPERDYVSLYSGRVIRGLPTTCGLCPAGCGMLAFVDEGSLVGLAGNPRHPYNRGALCAFGSAATNRKEGSSRVRKPLKRLGARGEGRWEEISREEALRTLTRVLGGLRGAPSAPGLAVCLQGWKVTPLVTRFMSLFPTDVLTLTDGHEQQVERAVNRSFGPSFDWAPDLAQADRVLNFGANPLGSIRRLVGTARQWAEGQDRGVRWITLDPRLSETAAASHAWIPLRPGSDGAFALALAHEILRNEWENRSFLENETDADRGTLWEALVPWAPSKVAAYCEIPPDQIRSIAREFALADRPVAFFGSGVTARRNGLETAQAILLLNVLAGSLHQQGGSPHPVKFAWRQPDPCPASEREVSLLTGTLFWDLQRGRRQIGCLLSYDANPAVTDPDADETARTLRNENRVPFHVALATDWNETARLADLVLPASTFLESWGLVESAGVAYPSPWISLRQPVCRPQEGTLCLDELLLEMAGRLGGEVMRAFPFRDVEDYYRRLLEESLSSEGAVDAFAAAAKSGFIVVPRVPEKGQEEVRVRGVLAQCVTAIAERLGEEEDKRAAPGERTLILYVSPTRGGLGPVREWVDEIDHADPVWIHPKAAEEIGCRDGDRVMLSGPAGSVETRVRLTEGIHPLAVAMPARGSGMDSQRRCPSEAEPQKGSDEQPCWWKGEAYGANARKVIPWPGDPGRESPGWMDTRVTLVRLDKDGERAGSKEGDGEPPRRG